MIGLELVFFLVLHSRIPDWEMLFLMLALFNSTSDLKILCLFFWSKMVFKKLHELTANELRIELKRAGIKGKYVKAEAIMRLTTHLIDVSENPIEFEFDPEVPVEPDVDNADGDEYEVVTDHLEAVSVVSSSAENTAASVPGLVNIISSVTSTTTSSVTATTASTPIVSTASSGSMSAPASTFTTTSATNSFPYSH